VRCKRCGEATGTRVSLRNDLSIRYGERGQPAGYHARKVLVSGQHRCYHPIEVLLTFDASRGLVSREITGGEFISSAEYASESAEE
jgi:hypothetical protein